ncbi:hypothetical protein CG709_04105, partial [Lachnotalea glycerini]
MRLFYTKPATKWEETLPVGNGSLGAMIWGGTTLEKIGLNEESLWSGYYHDKNNPNAANYLQDVRDLIQNGEYVKAEELIRDNMLGEYNESYLPLGNLKFQFEHNEEIDDYKRSLDLQNSIAHVSYKADEIFYTREYFASYPTKAILIKFTCDKPKLNLSISFESELKSQISYTKDGINISGQCPEHVDPNYVDSIQPVIQGNRGILFDAGLK